MILLVLSPLASVGCAASYVITQAPTQPLSTFTAVSVPNVETQAWLDQNPYVTNDAQFSKWPAEIKLASTRIPEFASAYLKKYFNGDSNTDEKSLLIKTVLIDYNPGSRAARYWGGLGAGKGIIAVRVTVMDQKSGEIIAQGEAFGTVAGGLFGGSFHSAYEACGKGIARMIIDNYK